MHVVTLTVKPSLDTTITVDRMEPNRKLPVLSVEDAPGGGGLNVARVLHEFGTPAEALWIAGGTFGPLIDRLLREAGIPNRAIHTGETGQSIAVIERSTGDHYRFSAPGFPIGVDDAVRLASLVGDETGWVVVSGGLPVGSPVEAYARLVERGAAVGAKVIVDARGDALIAALETGSVYLVKPNERELADVCRQLGIHGSPDEQARELIDRYGLTAVVRSLGPTGAVLVTADGTQRVDAPPVELVSKIGAGDSLVAGLVHCLVSGRDLLDALRFGVAAGSAAVTTPGTDLCTRARTDELYASMRT